MMKRYLRGPTGEADVEKKNKIRESTNNYHKYSYLLILFIDLCVIRLMFLMKTGIVYNDIKRQRKE